LRDDDASEITRLVRELVGRRLDSEGGSLTSYELSAALARSGLEANLIQHADAVLAACDAALYGSTRNGNLRRDALDLARAFAESA
jgi:hypothetical protein